MNKQQIEERISAITNEMAMLKANYAKLEGHLNEAQHWLMQLELKEKSTEETAETQESQESHPEESIKEEESCP